MCAENIFKDIYYKNILQQLKIWKKFKFSLIEKWLNMETHIGNDIQLPKKLTLLPLTWKNIKFFLKIFTK
jgi:hypothetical protein